MKVIKDFEKDAKIETAENRNKLIDFIGQSVSNHYNQDVGMFTQPNLVVNINGTQFSISVSVKETALPLSSAKATFKPDK